MLSKQFHHLFYYPFTINLTLQPIGVIFINNWAMPIKEVVVIHCYLDQRCVTVNSLRDGIILWELHHHCSNDSNDYNAFKIIIFLRSRSLPLLLKPEWSQSKHETQDMGIRIPFNVLWQPTRWGMVSFCGSCSGKNANNACASIQMWCRLVRLVYDCSS